MNIYIRVIPHSEQRLNQPGDWWFQENGDLQVRVTDLGDWRFNLLLGRHEQDEACLCKHAGISTETVDSQPLLKTDDPDSFSGYPGAPYQAQHNDALAAEWVMSRLLGVDWVEYGKAFTPFWDKERT